MRRFPRLYRTADFDPTDLLAAKDVHGDRVSVCLPARNEEATVGAIVTAIGETLVADLGLVDEVIVVDDGSTDQTATVAASGGARVVSTGTSVAGTDVVHGKGEALWTSLYASTGDIVCWVDADIRNFSAGFVVGLLGPLLTRTDVAFVKGCYRRPLGDGGEGGGRVTELVARPVLSRLFPYLAGIVQPLAGEYAGRRSVLETLSFPTGWGVDLALLIDIADRCGLDAIAQVDLGARVHRNRPLAELAPQAMAILVTALRRAGIGDREGWGDDLVAFDGDLRLTRVDVDTGERPPMVSVPAYRAKFGRELSA